MAHTIEGTYTIKELLQKTATSSKFKNRFDYKDRDRVKLVAIRSIKYFEPDRLNAPSTKIQVVTRSTPKYAPYKPESKSGRLRKRRVNHQYDITFECDRLSINTKNWTVMIGSGRSWIKNPPQSKIHSIYRENLKRWSKEKIEAHRKRKGVYESVGDWNAQVRGINADWIFTQSYCFDFYKHRFGREYGLARNTPPNITNKSLEMAAPKHLISFFESLMRSGILKND